MFLTKSFHEKLRSDTYTIEILLLLLSLAVGINDAAIFIDFHLFISNQTGNTIFIGIGALSGASSTYLDLQRIGLSLGGFLSGALISGQIGNHIGKRQRGWVIFSSTFQTCLNFIATALRHWYAISAASQDRKTLSVIAILAFSAGVQVEMAKSLGVPEIPTAMLTAAMTDLMAARKLWRLKDNRPRDRRLFFILTLLVGSFIGAATHEYVDPAMPLLLAAIVKTVATVGFCFAAAEPDVVIQIEKV